MSSQKSQVDRGYRKDRCGVNQALVMINLYVKFNVHSSYAKQVIVLKVGSRQTDGRTDAPGDDNKHLPSFWLRPRNSFLTLFTVDYLLTYTISPLLLPKSGLFICSDHCNPIPVSMHFAL